MRMPLIIGNVNYYYRVPLRRSAYHVPIINTRAEVIATIFFFFFLRSGTSLCARKPRRKESLIDNSETGVYSIKTGTSRQYWHSAVTEYNISDKGQQWKQDSGKRRGRRRSIVYRTTAPSILKWRRKYRELNNIKKNNTQDCVLYIYTRLAAITYKKW